MILNTPLHVIYHQLVKIVSNWIKDLGLSDYVTNLLEELAFTQGLQFKPNFSETNFDIILASTDDSRHYMTITLEAQPLQVLGSSFRLDRYVYKVGARTYGEVLCENGKYYVDWDREVAILYGCAKTVAFLLANLVKKENEIIANDSLFDDKDYFFNFPIKASKH